MWPLPPGDAAKLDSALAVARDFSAQVLGVTENTIIADPSAPANGPIIVTIELPASSHPVPVLASPTATGTWALLSVGNQADQEGITFGPDGATMALHPPAGATQADITERAGAGIVRVHLNEASLRTGTAQLTGSSIHDVIVVFRNANGLTIGAIGSEY